MGGGGEGQVVWGGGGGLKVGGTEVLCRRGMVGQERRRKIKLFKCQTSSKYLCLHPPSILSQSLITFISVLTGLYTLTECPLYRNTNTYSGPENDQVKNVDLATEKS